MKRRTRGIGRRTAGEKHRPPLGRFLRSRAKWLLWRYRYLIGFTIIGISSLILEIILIEYVLPEAWPRTLRLTLGFIAGLLFAFFGNAKLNFRVARRFWWYSFGMFTAISLLSLILQALANIYVRTYFHGVSISYPVTRLMISGSLFVFIYTLHRRFVFRRSTRNLGVAVYLNEETDVDAIYRQIGDQVDHIHIDLVDETFKPDARVNLEKLHRARRTWTWQPFCLHLMTRHPLRWIEQTKDACDLFLFHLNSEDDPYAIIACCRSARRQVGVVWHVGEPLERIMPMLPHVDVVLVLGIEKPGYSGQPMMAQAQAMAETLDEMMPHYHYEIAADGGVTTHNVHLIQASIIVTSSAVLQSENPMNSMFELLSGGRHES